MQWIQLKDDSQICTFISAAYDLHPELIAALNKNEVPFFFDYWLKLLNHSDAWLLNDSGKNLALVTKPKKDDVHYERWQYNTLAIDPLFTEQLELPFEIQKYCAFTVTSFGDKRKNFSTKFLCSSSQQCFARTMDGLKTLPSTPGITFKQIELGDIASVSSLFDSGYDWGNLPDYYLSTLRGEIVRAANFGAGWCYLALDNSELVGIASYLAFTTPLLGVNAALVGDLLVAPDRRGKGLASALQLYAYQEFKRAGLRWIIGNIDPANLASIRQAKKVGREPLVQTLELKPK